MKRKRVVLLVGLWLGLTFCGCGSKSTVVLIPDPSGRVGQVTVSNQGGQRVLNEANQAVKVRNASRPGKAAKISDEKIRRSFSDVLEAQPLPPITFILYFLQDSNELTVESKSLLPEIMRIIQERKDPDIVVTGHTDTVGDKDYNYRLALERAKVLEAILLDNGIVSKNITVTSHGEGNPLVKTDDDVPELKNRRVEVVVK